MADFHRPYDGTGGNGSLYAEWFQTNGQKGKEPPEVGDLKKIYANFMKAFGVPEEEPIKLGKEIRAIAADQVYTIGVVGLAAAVRGSGVQEQPGQYPRLRVQQPGRQDACHLPHHDTLFQVVPSVGAGTV